MLNTAAISLGISILSIAISGLNVYWTTLRPPKIGATMTIVIATSAGGDHITIPTSISNGGARPATVLNAKLIEGDGGRQSLWGAEFATTVDHAFGTINGAPLAANARLFVPFLVPADQEVQTVLVFEPVDAAGFTSKLLARSGKTLRYTLVLNTTAGDVTVTKSVDWSGVTNGALDKRAFGVAQGTVDATNWFSLTTPVP